MYSNLVFTLKVMGNMESMILMELLSFFMAIYLVIG